MNEFPVVPKPSKSPNITIILIIVLAIGSLSFGVAAIVFFSRAHTATTTLAAQKASAATAARNDQKTNDTAATLAATESPFRNYIAPTEYGAFVIKFPKNWSGYVDEERSASIQVSLIIHPNFVKRENNADVLSAAHIYLIQKTQTEYLKQFSSVKNMKQVPATVSGLSAVTLTGSFPDKRSLRQVVVPVRDKVLVFVNEASAYSAEFDQILAQAKIVP